MITTHQTGSDTRFSVTINILGEIFTIGWRIERDDH